MTASCSRPPVAASSLSTVFAVAISTTLLPSRTCDPTRRPPTLSLGESQTPPAPRRWPDLQGQRYAPLSPHQGRTHSHHCHPHCPPLQRASTHRRSRMNLCSTTTISGVSSTEEEWD